MKHIKQKIDQLNWTQVAIDMNDKGYAIIQDFLSADHCEELLSLYDKPTGFRKTVVMERHRFGLGAYKYFDYPLPDLIQTIRENIYPNIAPIANGWMKALKIDTAFAPTLEQLLSQCHEQNQTKPTPLILRYGSGGYNTLHQDLYGEVYFPMQLVLFLDAPEVDYSGGEFVMTQQTPRAQSKAIVLKPKKGDMLLFTTNFRPVKGTRGYYRVNMKHGVSELHRGKRHTLGIIFHDAKS